MSGPRLRLEALGRLTVARGERAGATLLTAPRPLATLAYLALARPRGLHARDTLIALLWPESDQSDGRHAVRNALHAIRAAVGEGVIVTAGADRVGIDPERIRCDALELEAHLEAGRVERAVAAYEGDLLLGFHVPHAPEFERWLDGERQRLRDRVLAALAARIDVLRAEGRSAEALELARRAAALDPDSEVWLRRQIELLATGGELAAAERAFEEFAARMRDAYGDEPSAELVALMDELRGSRSEPSAGPPLSSVAILPFVDQTPGRDAGDLCDALAAGVIGRLARLTRLAVRASGVSAPYRMASNPLHAGRALGVDAVVTGRVRRPAGDAGVVADVEVVRVADGTLLHAAAIRASRGALHGLEGEIARAVAGALKVRISGADLRAMAAPSAADGEAYVLYVRGQYLFLRAAHGGHDDDLDQSRAFFEQALERDPGFALALAGLSNYFAVAAVRNRLRPFDEHFGRALEISARTVALDATLAIPHVHFGVKAMYLDDDWDAAERELRTAVSLDPMYPEAQRLYGICLGALGRREEGLAALREAVRLEPHIPILRNSLAAALMAAGSFDEAAAELRRALELDPQYDAARQRLIRCHERLGRWAEAVAERRSAVFQEAWASQGVEGYRRARATEIAEEIQRLEALVCAEPRSATDRLNPPQVRLALDYAELGDWERAKAWMDHACDARPGRLPWFRSQSDLGPLFA